MEKDKAIKIGLLLVIIAGIMFWGFNFLKGKNVFTKEYTYYTIFERIDGLQQNSSVLLRGNKVGQVTNIYFTSETYKTITVELAINKDVKIPKGTIAKIFSSDIMGTKSIDLILPNFEPNTPRILLKNNDTLITSIEGSITDQVRLEMAPIKKQAEKLMESTATAIEQLKFVLNESTGEYLKTSFLKIQSAVDAIQHSSVTIDTILTKSNYNIQMLLENLGSISENIKAKNKEIEHTITNMSKISDTLVAANIAQTIKKTNSAMTQLDELITSINKGEGTIGALAKNKEIYSNLESVSKQLDNLIIDLQKNPKKYVSFPLMNINKSEK